MLTATPTTKLLGSSVTLSLRGSGSPVPTYQWSFNGDAIFQATNTSYLIPSLKASDAGFYSAHASNDYGDADTGDTGLTELIVVTPPKITTQPAGPPDPILNGDSYTFTVDADGDALAYQWRLNGVNIPGETDMSTDATNAGVYSVRISNSINGVGGSAISSNATLVVWFPPQITVQPTSRTVLAGKSTTFNVTATGTKPLKYQWLQDDAEIPGATTNFYTIKSSASTDAGVYKVHIWNETNSIYQETYSEPVDLEVLVPPTILAQPLSTNVNPGDDVLLSVDIQDDATWPLEFQWRFNGTNIENGGDGETLYLPDVDQSNDGYYSVVISNPAGSFTSTSARVIVRQPPLITSQPSDVRVGFGTNLTFSVRATGTGPLQYQWLFNNSLVAGATNSSLAFKAATTNQNGLYSVFISNVVDVVTSTPAQLTIIAETFLPTVTITNPAVTFITVTNPLFNLAGKASDNVGVSKVLYQLNSDPYIPANGSTVWSATLGLTPGTNLVRVKSIDSSGNTSLIVNRTIFFSVKSLLTLVTNGGPGTISAPANRMLEINRAYTITATPGIGQIFAGWTGTISSNTAALRFMMQSNMVLQANFIPDPFLPRKGVYNGLFYETNGVRQISSGGFTMTLFEKGGASGKINMSGVSYTFTNHFDATGAARFNVLRLNQTPLVLTLWIDVTNMADQVSGTVSNSAWNSMLLADRNIFSKTTNPAPFAGIYSLVIPGQTNNSVPLGDGYGVATVDAAGTARLIGALSDGTSIAQGTTISKNGDFPLYVPLYSGKGFILSWLTLANSNSVGGDFSWFRSANSLLKLYPAGFTNLISLEGGVFVKPPKGTRVLNFTNGVISLRGGNLPNDITDSIVLTTNNTLVISSTNRLALTLNATNGVITGSFIHPKTKLSTPIKGILVRQENQGRGFFLGTNQAGIFSLQSN